MSKLLVILSLVALAASMPGGPDWSGELGWNAHRYGDVQSDLEVGHGHGSVGQVKGTVGGSESGQGHNEEHISLFGPQGAQGQVGLHDHPQEVHDQPQEIHDHHYYHQH